MTDNTIIERASRFGKFVSVDILSDMAHYCQRLDKVEKELYQAETFKGKDHIWVELVGAKYVIYGNVDDVWYAEYYDLGGYFVRSVEKTRPFDFRGV